MQRSFLVLLMIALTACSPRGAIRLDPTAAGQGDAGEVFVATTRTFVEAENSFGPRRSETETFGRYVISIPRERDLGSISFPPRNQKADPNLHFVTLEQELFKDASAFRSELAKALRSEPQGKREVTIYVHGFNNTFAEGLYRIAQLSHDLEMPGVTLHYSWPSAGTPLGYVSDRDSAMFARDGLEQLMREAAAAGAERILMVAHSMGSALTMEALRQVAIRGDRDLRARMGGVILISPDIDVDLFRMQARAYGDLPKPFLIFGSGRDRLLTLSARLTGQPERLGNLRDLSRVGDLEVTFLDTRAYSAGAGHFDLADSPALLQLMQRIGDVDRAFGADEIGRVGLLPGVVLTVQSATEIVLAPVAAVAGELAN